MASPRRCSSRPIDTSCTTTPQITVVSTRTVDKIPTGNGRVLETPGGPAYYISEALNRLPCRYRLITGSLAIVDVVRSNGHEAYVIPALPAIPLPSRLPGEAVILSPIMREIDPDAVPAADGLLVVDLQGFVRDPSRPSHLAVERVRLAPLLARADIVKAGEHELELVDDESLAHLDACLLIKTAGRAGAVISEGGREYVIPARPVDTANTIGAGDTFLASFVCAFLRGNSIQESGSAAARFTEEFLVQRERRREGV